MSGDRGVSMQSLPRAGRWSIYIGLAVLFAIACVWLSNWQFSRNDDRAAQLALVEQNYDADPVALEEVIPVGDGLSPADEWRPVVLRGEYLAAEQITVRNRPHGGTSAFEVLAPFRLSDGRVVIVDRGWVPPAEEGTGPAVVPDPPLGESTVIVRLRPEEAAPTSGRSAPEGQVPTINVDLIGGELSPATADALIGGVYGILVSETPAVADTPASLPSPSQDPGPHLSYAIQWILFALMGFIFIGYVIRTERRHRLEDEQDARDDAVAPPPSRRRRRDRDADDEDALLDADRARATRGAQASEMSSA
ncbi:SURF1 family cytochrome oxidase biogenesis protein [Microbacterium aurantiacum]|uniref:SURF1 family cytochrome oxidase biogenesis protein n=1 Tax=Microbacterium aurantiacum TaxID=162393 RepID=UPI0027E0BBD8|nr:SURF1 family protein [Microbacterium aurantiacum]